MSPIADRSPVSLRTVLVVLVAGALVASAGCTGALDGGGDGSSASVEPALDVVPAGSDAVFYADVNGALDDDELRSVADTMYSTEESAPDDLDEAIERAQDNVSLELSGVQAVTAYGQNDSTSVDDAYGAAVVSADWSTEELIDAMENDSEITFENETYAGHDIYLPADDDDVSSAVGVVSDTRYVIGDQAAVEDALEVANGDADAFEGDVRDAFENTPDDAHVRFAVGVPQNQYDTGDAGGSQFDTGIFNDVSVVSGSQSTPDGNVSLSMTAQFGSESNASDAGDATEGIVQIARVYVQDNQTQELLADEHLSIETDGADLTITATNSVETITDLIESLDDSGVGTASTQASVDRPTVA